MIASLWEKLESKKIFNREEIENHLCQKLGEPKNELQHNLLFELVKKISAYYAPETKQSYTNYSMLGTVSEIVEKRFKEGKRRGQIFYSLKLSEPPGEKFRALREDLPTKKWTLIQKSAILGQKFVFKYKFWLTNKDLLDFSPTKKPPKKVAEGT